VEREIEITDAMVGAGLAAYHAWDRRYEEPEGLVIAVFEAMALAQRVLDEGAHGAGLGPISDQGD
jgi:hypothetical protein